jgi:hypothetical protein
MQLTLGYYLRPRLTDMSHGSGSWQLNKRLHSWLHYWPIQFEHNNDLMLAWALMDVRVTLMLRESQC